MHWSHRFLIITGAILLLVILAMRCKGELCVCAKDRINQLLYLQAGAPSSNDLDTVYWELVLCRPAWSNASNAWLHDRLWVAERRYMWRDRLEHLAFQASQDAVADAAIPEPWRINVPFNRINSRLGLDHRRDEIYITRMEPGQDLAS